MSSSFFIHDGFIQFSMHTKCLLCIRWMKVILWTWWIVQVTSDWCWAVSQAGMLRGLTMSIYKNCPIWLNIWTAAAYIARLARSIKWVNQYMISCSISNFKSNADNEDHLKSLSVFFFTCTPLIRNEYLFYGNKGLKLPSDLAILSTFGRLRWLHHSLRQMRFIKVIYIWYVRV